MVDNHEAVAAVASHIDHRQTVKPILQLAAEAQTRLLQPAGKAIAARRQLLQPAGKSCTILQCSQIPIPAGQCPQNV